MEFGNAMEKELQKVGVWIPLTPGKPIPARPDSMTFNDINSVKKTGIGFEVNTRVGSSSASEELAGTGSAETSTSGIEFSGNPSSSLENRQTTFGKFENLSFVEILPCSESQTNPISSINILATTQHDKQYADGMDKVHHSENEGGKIPSVTSTSTPTPSEKRNTKKRQNNGIDLSKKPRKRPKMKKHRPKILDEWKPKLPKAQTSTPKPNTPKPSTPKRATRKYTRKNNLKGLDATSEEVDEQAIYKSPECATKTCKRSLNFNLQVVEPDTDHVVKSCNQAPNVNLQVVGPDPDHVVKSCNQAPNFNLDSITTKSSLVSSDLRNVNEQSTEKQQRGGKDVKRIIYQYQRRKRIVENLFGNCNLTLGASSDKDKEIIVENQQNIAFGVSNSDSASLRVYQRKFRVNQCEQNSRKIGPKFPRVYKKIRMRRQKKTAFGTILSIIAEEVGVRQVKRAYNRRKPINRKLLARKLNYKRVEKAVKKSNCTIVGCNFEMVKRFLKMISPTEEQTQEAIADPESFKCVLSLRPISNSRMKRSKGLTHRRFYVDNEIKEPLLLHEDNSVLHQEDNFVEFEKGPPLQEFALIEIGNCYPQHQDVLPTNESLLKDAFLSEVLDYVLLKFMCLQINNECKQLVVQDHNANGALVKYDTPKKRKVLPKVALDEETLRVWKLLMWNDGNESAEEIDEDKEKWWKEQREIFRGRVESFIARMHLIQGDRRFSLWKGSVVDSVVGVYLTQNVSDILSSSAFMFLAARFPVKSRSKEIDDDVEVVCIQESIGSNIVAEEHVRNRSGTEQDIRNECANVGNEALAKKCEQAFSVQDSRGSFNDGNPTTTNKSCANESSTSFREVIDLDEALVTKHGQAFSDAFPVQDTRGFFSDSNPTTDNKPCANESSTSFRQVLDLEEALATKCKQAFSDGFPGQDTRCTFNDGKLITTNKPCANESSTSFRKVIDLEEALETKCERAFSDAFPVEDTRVSFNDGDPTTTDKPCANESSTSFREVLDLEETNFLKQFCSVENDKVSSSNDSIVNGDLDSSKEKSGEQNSQKPSTIVPNAPFDLDVDLWDSLGVFGNTEMEDIGDKSGNIGSLKHSGCESSETIVQEKATPKEKKPITVDPKSLGKSLQSEGTTEHEKNLKTETASRKKKSKVEEKQETKIDWEELRKSYCNCKGRENKSDTMDSVDWKAVRNAKVEEIAETIEKRGMNNVLAGRIKDFLDRMVKDHGNIDLEWLRDVPEDKAKDFLLSIQGIGLKSVECVRLLTLHHLAFPVDTNVGRVAVRLGWVPLQPLPEEVQIHLLNSYPLLDHVQKYLFPRLCTLDQPTLYELHYQLITFGKVFCTKRNPNCNACPMRAECRHYASAFASARLALPGPKEKSIVTSDIPAAADQNPSVLVTPLPALSLQDINISDSSDRVQNCEPIIEVPPSPEPEPTEPIVGDIEDYFCHSDDEIPTIRLNTEEFKENLRNIIDTNNIFLQEADVSEALVALTTEAASIRVPRMKFESRLRTVHQVYELPDSHPLLSGFENREPDDPCPYLLAIWSTGDTSKSSEQPQKRDKSRESEICSNNQEENPQTVGGTILIPCRTATRGTFPLNGTYFQVNEVFADDESSQHPINVPRQWIWNLPRRSLHCGTSATSIFRGLSTDEIQYCFWRGFICVRGFNKVTRVPRPLHVRFHVQLLQKQKQPPDSTTLPKKT